MNLEDLIYGGSAFFGGMLTIAFIFFLVMLVALAIPVVAYVLHSLGLYAIADRRGLRHKWLAWLPFGSVWLLGSISDQYQYVAKGKIRYLRRWLLLLNITTVAIDIGCIGTVVGNILLSDYVAAVIAHTLGGWMALAAALLVYSILQWVAYYDLFRSCQPSNAVLYLVLSILFPAILPLFVFFARKKDLGMPPRKRPTVAEIIVEAPAEETVEAFIEEPAEEITEE